MNHIYRVIFNRTKGMFVVVSETARAQGKKSEKSNKSVLSTFFQLTALSSLTLAAIAPVNAAVVGSHFVILDVADTGASNSATNNTTVTDGSLAIAIGAKAGATGTSSIAIGNGTSQTEGAKAEAAGAIVIGNSVVDVPGGTRKMTKASNTAAHSIAIGTAALVETERSVALGSLSTISTDTSTFSRASDVDANSSNTRGRNIAIGDNTVVYGYLNSSVGSGSVVGLGSERSSSLGYSSAIGRSKSNSFSDNGRVVTYGALAVGSNSDVYYGSSQSIAIGDRAKVYWSDYASSTATAPIANADTRYAIALGSQAQVYTGATAGIAIGKNARVGKTLPTNNTPIDNNGTSSVAIGDGAIAEGATSVVIGKGSWNINEAQKNIILGSGNINLSPNSILIGNNIINRDVNGSVSRETAIATKNFVALGNDIVPTLSNSIYLGDGSTHITDTTKSAVVAANTTASVQNFTYTYSGDGAAAPVGVLTIGGKLTDGTLQTRRLQGLSTGLIAAGSTDAINGAQLYAVANTLGTQVNTNKTKIDENATAIAAKKNVDIVSADTSKLTVTATEANGTKTFKLALVGATGGSGGNDAGSGAKLKTTYGDSVVDVVKVGDEYYKASDVTNGTANTGAQPINSADVVVSNSPDDTAKKLTNVASSIGDTAENTEDSRDNDNSFISKLAKAGAADSTAKTTDAATVGDLKNLANTPLFFSADNTSEKFAKKLGEKVEVVSGQFNLDGTTLADYAKGANSYNSNNLAVVTKDGKLQIGFKDQPVFDSVKVGGDNGVVIGSKPAANGQPATVTFGDDTTPAQLQVSNGDGTYDTVATKSDLDKVINDAATNGVGPNVTAEDGSKLVKVGDDYYKASDIDSATGQPKADATPVAPNEMAVSNATSDGTARTLNGVKSAIDPARGLPTDATDDGDAVNPALTGKDFTTALNTAAENSPNTAVNIGDLKQVNDIANKGWVVKTSANGGAVDNASFATNGETINPDNNMLEFVAGEHIKLKQEAGKITISTDNAKIADAIANSDNGPFSYKDAAGNRVYKVTDAAGNVTYNTQADGTGDNVAADKVATAVNSPSGRLTGISSGLVDENGNAVALKDATGNTLTNAVNVGDLQKYAASNDSIAGATDKNGERNAANVSKISAGEADPNNPDAPVATYVGTITKNVVDANGNPVIDQSTGKPKTIKEEEALLTTYNVHGNSEVITNSLVTAIYNMNEQGIKFFHTNDGTAIPKEESDNTIDSSASGAFATAVGYQSKANGAKSIAFGSSNTVNGDESVAIGSGNLVSGVQSIAVGTGHSVTGNNSGTFGDPNIVSGNESYAFGNNNSVAADQAFVVGNNATVSSNATGAVAIGHNTRVTEANGVALGAGAQATLTIEDLRSAKPFVLVAGTESQVKGTGNEVVGEVSVGSAGNTRRITNVAAGSAPTDAVNVSQFELAVNSLAQQNSALAQQQHQLGKKVERYNRDMKGGVAGALATAGLPQAYVPGKSMIAASGSTFNGENAVALGVSRISDNGKVVFKLSGTSTSRGQYGATIGAGYQW